LLGQLAVHGVAIKLDRLYEGRSLKDADLKALLTVPKDENPSPTTWLVNGARAKPYAAANGSGPEKIHIAQQITARTNTIEQPSAASSGEQNSTPEAARRPWTDIRKTPAKTGSSEASLYTSSPLSGDGTSHVMLQYQQLMQRFLETQKGVMLTYLQGATDHAEADTFEANQALQNLQTPSVSPTQQISAQKISSEQAQIKTHLNAEPPAQDVAGSPTAGEASMDREGLILQLLAIVSERTGYPQEMLDLDLDLEADLGIDSIKRMEIFGIFLQNIASSQRQEIEGKIDELTKLKTLRLITEWLQEHTVSDTTDGAKEYESSGANVLEHSEKNTLGDPSVHRFTLVTECLPAADPPSSLADNGVIFITDDERGIASNLVDELKARGHRVALIQLGSKTEEVESGCYRSALNSPEDTGELLEIIRQRQGVIGGLIHLLPLKEWIPWEAIDLSHWKERIELEVKSLFFLIKNLEEDLTKAAQNGGACIIGATGMGGRFASDSSPPSQKFFPGHGAIAGLLKTAAIEWPHVKVRVVDLKIEDDATNLSRHLLAEMSSDDHVVEVGYDGSQRLYLKPILSPLNQNRPNATNLDSSSVILVTGGARGITAEVARELAQRYRPTLILIGRSPLPAEQEAHETARLVCAQELKSALIAERQRRSQPVNLQEVEADYRHLLKEREIRENIAAMRAAGAKVNYFQVDVRDENRFGGLIDEIYKNYGRLDGVIHGDLISLNFLSFLHQSLVVSETRAKAIMQRPTKS
jgi:NAD(P)-dependent dehydrogenase (short-subunit alcohol dehydrogenase family)